MSKNLKVALLLRKPLMLCFPTS